MSQRRCLEGTLVHAFFWHPCFASFSIARLHAAVVLNPRYPEVAPLFSLSLSWKGERSGHTDDNLRVWTFSYTKSLVHNFVVVAVMVLLGSNNLLLFLSSFVRQWRARWMCLKMSFRDHVQDTSSWPIRSLACASAWTCIWRLKDKMTESRGHESFPEKRCVCAPWGKKNSAVFTLYQLYICTHCISDFCLFFLGVQIVWSHSSTTILRASLVTAKSVHVILPAVHLRFPLASPSWLFDTPLFESLCNSLK